MYKIDSISIDYKSIASEIERWIIYQILKLLLRKIPVELDFQDGNVKKLNELTSKFHVAPPSLSRLLLILWSPEYHLPATFVDGKWFCSKGSISELIVFMQYRDGKDTRNSGLSFGVRSVAKHRYKHYLRPSSLRETRKHYNEDVRLYKKIIGDDLVYSCAFFNSEHDDLYQAQNNKLNITLERLNVTNDPHAKILDIGCGWGSFIFHAVKTIEGQFDGISIAESQIKYAKGKCSKLSDKEMSSRINFYCSDYEGFRSEESEIYNSIVSIGMLEHVGKTQYKNFFSEVYRLLSIGGTGVVHTITRKDDGITNPWIDEYIFPGGYIPRASEVLAGLENSKLDVIAIHQHNGINYQKTLSAWLDNLCLNEEFFLEVLSENISRISPVMPISKRNYEARRAFRIWYFYLASIQSIFDRRGGCYDISQFVFTKYRTL